MNTPEQEAAYKAVWKRFLAKLARQGLIKRKPFPYQYTGNEIIPMTSDEFYRLHPSSRQPPKAN